MTAPAPFSAACGQLRPLRLAVEHTGGGRVAEGELDQPFALIGSADGCEITLNHPDVPEHVACLQVLDGVTYVVTLADSAVHTLTPESPFTVGPFVLRLFEPHAEASRPATDPLRDPVSGRQLPCVRLLGRGVPRELEHRWTFLDQPARAYVVLTPDGPFVVDLQSAETKVNGSVVRLAMLANGDELIAGAEEFTVMVGHSDPVWQGTSSLSSVAGALLGGPSPDTSIPDIEEYVSLVQERAPDPAESVAAVSRKWSEFHALLVGHFRQRVEDLITNFGKIRREQLVHLRDEFVRWGDGPPAGFVETVPADGVSVLPAQPVGLPTLLLPPPTGDLPVSDDTAAMHQAVYDRLLSLEQERQGLWRRMRGLLGG